MKFENDIIRHVENENIEYIQFKRLLKYPNINHAYIFKTHNMNFRVKTDFSQIEQTKRNLKIMCDNCGFKYETIIRPDYWHTTNVSIVDNVDISKEIPEISAERFPKTDGLVTNKNDITIMSTNADCLLVLLYDPIKNVIGNVHCGWKGSFGKIILNAIDKMKSGYGCNPKDIEAYFSPCIRKCHFEVDEDVMHQCKEIFNYTGKINEIIEVGDIKDEKQKYLIDNVLINKILLLEAGLKEENIVDCGICSICEKDKIHSRRAEGLDFGLGALFITKTN